MIRITTTEIGIMISTIVPSGRRIYEQRKTGRESYALSIEKLN